MFFSEDAHDMAAQLIETAQLGFLSDPVGVSLYYQMGIDKDGSNHRYILSELCVQSLLNIMLTGDHQCQPLSLYREKNSLVLEPN